jgi:glyoxylase-like metal-dependent hydrolase (beta-lactamase superfamily II)
MRVQGSARGGTATEVDGGGWVIDLGFQGRTGVIGAYLLAGNDELALIETGPSSTLPALLDGIRAAGFDPARLTAILLTHIHLDHAGAAGVLARANPDVAVYVHPVGAPHLIEPSRLVASATRIYGDQMGPLWGEIAPVPEGQIRPLADGETLSVAGRVLAALHTPGHAPHHVVFWDAAAGAAYTGDAGGIRMPGTDYVCPPTPPPDLDPEAWRESVVRLQALAPRRLYPTHYGVYDDAGQHLEQVIPNLDDFLSISQRALAGGADQEQLTTLLHNRMAEALGDVPSDVLVNLEWATPSYRAALGLMRYWRKRQAA